MDSFTTFRQTRTRPASPVQDCPCRSRRAVQRAVRRDVSLERAAGALAARHHATPTLKQRLQQPAGADQPLSASVREHFENLYGKPLHGVRIHSDPHAEWSASTLGARAFTEGSNIWFGAGQLDLGTSEGRHLLAHELAHVALGHRGTNLQAESSEDINDTRPAWLKTRPTDEKGRPYWRIEAMNLGHPRRTPLLGTVIHATKGGRAAGAIRKVASQEVSWHFTITRAGSVFQHVPLTHTAAHAGKKAKLEVGERIVRGLNVKTLGIELANWGPLVRRRVRKGKAEKFVYHPYNFKKRIVNDKLRPRVNSVVQHGSGLVIGKDGFGNEEPLYWEQYSPAQIKALKNLFSDLARKGWYEALRIVPGHETILPKKMDPGPAFPWDELEVHLAKLRQHAK